MTCKSNVYTPILPHSYTPFNVERKLSKNSFPLFPHHQIFYYFCIRMMRNRPNRKRIATLLTTIILMVPYVCHAQLKHHDWEDQSILQIHREAPRASFFSYRKESGDRQLSLDGNWKFHWTKRPDEQPAGFHLTDFDDRSWDTFPVPGEAGSSVPGGT